jgi:uncharacterized protein (DUF1684 family)
MAHPRQELMDWKRRVLEMYAAVRAAGGDPAACAAFRRARDELLATHPASPLPEADRPGFGGVPYFPHRPGLRVEAELEPDPAGAELIIPTSTGEPTRFTRVGLVRPVLDGEAASLAVYWLEGYGGGLFLPFRDALAGAETYGGGRYLLDTVKGADLGTSADGERLVLDFNYAYNPSCAYDPRWSCPLAPAENRIDVAVEAGEMAPAAST